MKRQWQELARPLVVRLERSLRPSWKVQLGQVMMRQGQELVRQLEYLLEPRLRPRQK